jgi:hypothetical protein
MKGTGEGHPGRGPHSHLAPVKGPVPSSGSSQVPSKPRFQVHAGPVGAVRGSGLNPTNLVRWALSSSWRHWAAREAHRPAIASPVHYVAGIQPHPRRPHSSTPDLRRRGARSRKPSRRSRPTFSTIITGRRSSAVTARRTSRGELLDAAGPRQEGTRVHAGPLTVRPPGPAASRVFEVDRERRW